MTPTQAALVEALTAAQESLDSINRYGLDTLSGRTDGPDDRAWQRAGVNEMTKRARIGRDAARAALAQAGAEPQQAPTPPQGWRFEVLSDDDVRAYAPDGETWLVRRDFPHSSFDGFAYRLFALLAAPTPHTPDTGAAVGKEER